MAPPENAAHGRANSCKIENKSVYFDVNSASLSPCQFNQGFTDCRKNFSRRSIIKNHGTNAMNFAVITYWRIFRLETGGLTTGSSFESDFEVSDTSF